jgi:hypothetical protein
VKILSKSTFLLVVTLMQVACVKDLPVKSGANQNKSIFVNCIFDAQTNWQLTLGFTTSYLSKKITEFVDNATVLVISSNGDTLQLISKGAGQYVATEKPKKGIVYKLKAIVPGYDTVSATDSIPTLSAYVNNITYDTLNYSPLANGEGGLVYLPPLTLNMEDSHVQHNSHYYFIEKAYLKNFAKDTATSSIDSALAIYNRTTDLRVDDLLLNPLGISYGTVLLSDASFNSSKFVINAHTRDYFRYERNTDLIVRFNAQDVIMRQPNYFGLQLWQYCLSEQLYKYYYSYFRQVQANYDYFGDFLYVEGNITNGFGIFGGREIRRINLTW